MRRTGTTTTRSQKFAARRSLAHAVPYPSTTRRPDGPRCRPRLSGDESFQGSNERVRDLLSWWTAARYRSNDINTEPRWCTGYINIMLSRFLVKRAPPRETVASATTAETGHRQRDGVERASIIQKVEKSCLSSRTSDSVSHEFRPLRQ